MIYTPHHYQDIAEQHIVDNKFAVLTTHGGAGLFMDMGLGKTVVTLTAANRWIYDMFETDCVLVIAPKRVAEHTWSTEIKKWDHLNHLTVSKILGGERDRKAALKVKADVYTINVENVCWLVSFLGGAWPFTHVIIDELTKFKSAKSARFKALRQVRPKIKRVVGLTGTPAPNGLLDLWSQLYLLDRGERLGPTISDYQAKFFYTNPYKQFDNYKIRREDDELIGEGYYEKKIYNKIDDICLSMKAEDYLELPELVFNDIEVNMDPVNRAKYDAFEKEQVLQLMNGEEVNAVNAGALNTKLLQYSNGAIYSDDKRKFFEIHDEKLDALDDVLEEANGKPVLIFYAYQHDKERILSRFKKLNPVLLKGEKEIDAWNRGEIGVMIAHPASAGHGLNLQAGGHIVVFFGLLWSLELYLQAIKRIHRQGQEALRVIVHRIRNVGTVDDAVVLSLDIKEDTQDALMRYTKTLMDRYKTAA